MAAQPGLIVGASQLQRRATAAVRAWCDRKGIKPAAISHVYPRAYVIGRAAPQCLVVAAPWPDASPHLQEFARANPLNTVHTFDASLDAGAWCTLAYVSTPTRGEFVAMPVVA